MLTLGNVEVLYDTCFDRYYKNSERNMNLLYIHSRQNIFHSFYITFIACDGNENLHNYIE